MATMISDGFDDPVMQTQAVFRAVLDATARPGRPREVTGPAAPPEPMMPGTAAVLLALADLDTPLWLDRAMAGSGGVADYLAFQCGAPRTDDPRRAVFAAIADPLAMPPLDAFALGSDEAPETSTTLLIQVADLRDDGGWRLTGPGIESAHRLAVDGLPDDFVAWRTGGRHLFPRGTDVILIAGRRLAALPRTTRIEE